MMLNSTGNDRYIAYLPARGNYEGCLISFNDLEEQYNILRTFVNTAEFSNKVLRPTQEFTDDNTDDFLRVITSLESLQTGLESGSSYVLQVGDMFTYEEDARYQILVKDTKWKPSGDVRAWAKGMVGKCFVLGGEFGNINIEELSLLRIGTLSEIQEAHGSFPGSAAFLTTRLYANQRFDGRESKIDGSSLTLYYNQTSPNRNTSVEFPASRWDEFSEIIKQSTEVSRKIWEESEALRAEFGKRRGKELLTARRAIVDLIKSAKEE